MQYFFENFLIFFKIFLIITYQYQKFTFYTLFLNNRFIHICCKVSKLKRVVYLDRFVYKYFFSVGISIR